MFCLIHHNKCTSPHLRKRHIKIQYYHETVLSTDLPTRVFCSHSIKRIVEIKGDKRSFNSDTIHSKVKEKVTLSHQSVLN